MCHKLEAAKNCCERARSVPEACAGVEAGITVMKAAVRTVFGVF